MNPGETALRDSPIVHERIKMAGACAIVGLDERVMQQMAEDGEIPAPSRFAAVWTFDEAKLRIWLADLERQQCRERESGRRRRTPKNTEWQGDTLYGRIRIKGKLHRWSLRTGDVELARQLVAEDIERLKAAAYHAGGRVRYADVSPLGQSATSSTRSDRAPRSATPSRSSS